LHTAVRLQHSQRIENATEWLCFHNGFPGKPVGLITASADGEKGYEELQLILKTLTAKFTDETILLIQGVKRQKQTRRESFFMREQELV
jgi:hypothetical protein